jgi:hypothetical protein
MSLLAVQAERFGQPDPIQLTPGFLQLKWATFAQPAARATARLHGSAYEARTEISDFSSIIFGDPTDFS